MKHVRRVRGVTKLDKVAEDVIRKRPQVESSLGNVDAQKPKWFGHLDRIESCMGEDNTEQRIGGEPGQLEIRYLQIYETVEVPKVRKDVPNGPKMKVELV